MIINNSELIQAKHDLIRQGESKYQEEISDLDRQIALDVKKKLDSIQSRADIQAEAIKDIPDIPSLRKQYQRGIEIYRNLNDLIVEIRETKKQIRKKIDEAVKRKKMGLGK
jgi:hypothetical protein